MQHISLTNVARCMLWAIPFAQLVSSLDPIAQPESVVAINLLSSTPENATQTATSAGYQKRWPNPGIYGSGLSDLGNIGALSWRNPSCFENCREWCQIFEVGKSDPWSSGSWPWRPYNGVNGYNGNGGVPGYGSGVAGGNGFPLGNSGYAGQGLVPPGTSGGVGIEAKSVGNSIAAAYSPWSSLFDEVSGDTDRCSACWCESLCQKTDCENKAESGKENAGLTLALGALLLVLQLYIEL